MIGSIPKSVFETAEGVLRNPDLEKFLEDCGVTTPEELPTEKREEFYTYAQRYTHTVLNDSKVK